MMSKIPSSSSSTSSTSSLSGGLLESSKSVDVYSGATEELTLSELLDSIPASDLDLQGEKGMVRDQVGISKLKKREAVAEMLTADLERTELERYLAPQEFQRLFKMGRGAFDGLPKWKRDRLKKAAGLF